MNVVVIVLLVFSLFIYYDCKASSSESIQNLYDNVLKELSKENYVSTVSFLEILVQKQPTNVEFNQLLGKS
jgi:outer membrane protein assembly factor BamD (BamD/ComL family)